MLIQRKNLLLNKQQLEALDNMEVYYSKVHSPLQSIEHRMHGFTSYFVMPVFAIANAGVLLSAAPGESVIGPLSINIALALILGKVLGDNNIRMAGHQAENNSPATGYKMDTFGWTWVPGRYWLYHVHVHQQPGLQGCRLAEPCQNRHINGFAGGRDTGLYDTEVYPETSGLSG